MNAGVSGHTGHRSRYTGRFAPSPTGPLHEGSLLTAVASYLDARSCGGRWLLRIEDIDPPREMAGASDLICHALQLHGLQWDGDVIWQSRHMDSYREALALLRDKGLVFPCSCTRSQLGAGGSCGERCEPAPGDPVAQRLRIADGLPGFTDRFLGPQPPQPGAQDLVLWRKDDLPAYQLAVSVDDGENGISDVVRGADLLETTAAQHLIITALGKTPPRYAHLPLLCDAQGRKLSKQNGAQPLDLSDPLANLQRALARLGQGVAAEPGDSVGQLLGRAASLWNPDAAVAAVDGALGELRWQEAPREACAP